MKKIRNYVIGRLLLLAGGLFAQTDSSQKSERIYMYEAGMNILGMHVSAGDFFSQYRNVLDQQVFSGIYFKIYRKQHALRMALDYSQRNIYFGQHPYSSDHPYRGRIKSLELKAGYQRMLGKRKLAPYVFADLEYILFSQNGSLFNNYSTYLYYNDYYGSYALNGSMYCVTPGLGLRWKMGSRVFANMETSAQLFYMRQTDQSSGGDRRYSYGVNVRPFKFSMGFTF